ncbi:hypothetical protein F2Q69_00050868 [Brassica cretica]|uniref:AAR2 N-terminal domain-containing protein n=1 Tax=Brassica cretica TaxID=69181 RepID=A0A8S9PSX3_BRACR|nr:hypothetical protein F2Q69_00050868 [Brassica cretica]
MFVSFRIDRKVKPRGGGGSDGFGKGTGTSEAWSYASISRRSSAYSHRNRYSGKFEYTFVLVGPAFKGIKMIPPGIHFVFYSSSTRDGKEFSPTIGFFVDVAPSQVCESVFPSRHFNTP